jgi:hypothetical protein
MDIWKYVNRYVSVFFIFVYNGVSDAKQFFGFLGILIFELLYGYAFFSY